MQVEIRWFASRRDRSSMKQTLRSAILGLALVLAALMSLGGCSSSPSRGRPFEDEQLIVFNWSDYIDADLLKEFEEKSGAEVKYLNYSNDGELEAKLLTGRGGYDVIVPSDRSLPVLLKKDVLAELDRSLLPNWKNLDPKVLGTRHDRNNRYTVPYFWGTLAVGIRTDHVKGDVKGFEVLFDRQYKGRIVMPADAEHAVAAALLHLRLPMNSTDDTDLAKVKQLLLEQKPLVQAYTDDAFKEKLIKGEAWVALGWNGDLLQAREEEPKVRCIVPETGTLIWVDSMAIPKGAPNPKLAHAFINFMLDADVASRNATKVRYASPNKAALARMNKDLLDDPAIYPPRKILDKCQWLEDRGQAIAKIQKLWREVKAQR
jgi:spermidine/putrescine transport system substrate-binding protein